MSDGWTAPDWASPGGAPSVPAPGPAAPGGSRTAVAEPEHVGLVGPRTPTELIDGAFAFLRRHAREVITTSALFVVPFALLVAFLQRDLLGGESFVDAFSSSDPSLFADDSGGGDALLQFVAFVGPSVGLVFVAAAMATMVAAERAGGVVDGAAAFGRALRAAPALLVSWLLVHLCEAVGAVLLVVPGVLALIGFSVVAPVVGIERLGPIEAMRRSWRLTARRRWPVLGVIAMSFFVETVVSQGLSLVPSVVAALIGFDVGWIILGIGTAAVGLITTPFVALVAVELYLDLRVRTEALDLELRIPGLFPPA